MKMIEILDCTLRDGGRIIDCKFPDEVIIGIGQFLCQANIDIIELGFLRNNINYVENSTFFGTVEQAERYVKKIGKERLSTKGKNRGHGLLLVKHLVSKNDKFEIKTEVINGLYIQTITIKKPIK